MRQVAIACHGGGSHAAFTAGVLKKLLAGQQSRGFQITGLSGTSGGAVCALLAWYGLIDDGVSGAVEALDRFWRDNAPETLWEALWNVSAVAASRIPVEVRTSPYSLPQSWFLRQVTAAAPRRQFLDLRLMLEDHVPFEKVRRISALAALGDEVVAWQCTPRDSGFKVRRTPAIDRERIRGILAAIDTLEPGYEPLANAIHVLEQRLDANAPEDELREAVRNASAAVPLLYLGAVDIRSGEFKAFSSRQAEIDIDAILASACLPWIFEAVQDRYWDGLFSQNPPIRNFTTDPGLAGEKPDEIWIVQINPQCCEHPIHSAADIFDRRTQLSGNLSLNQEVQSILAVNRWFAEGGRADPRYKRIGVHWIRMDTDELARDWPMDAASKYERDGEFLSALMMHGERQASLFFPARDFIETVWLEPDSGLRREAAQMLCRDVDDLRGTLEFLDSVYSYFHDLHFSIDGMDLKRAAGRHHALIQWSARGRHASCAVTLKGTTDLIVEPATVAEAAPPAAETRKLVETAQIAAAV